MMRKITTKMNKTTMMKKKMTIKKKKMTIKKKQAKRKSTITKMPKTKTTKKRIIKQKIMKMRQVEEVVVTRKTKRKGLGLDLSPVDIKFVSPPRIPVTDHQHMSPCQICLHILRINMRQVTKKAGFVPLLKWSIQHSPPAMGRSQPAAYRAPLNLLNSQLSRHRPHLPHCLRMLHKPHTDRCPRIHRSLLMSLLRIHLPHHTESIPRMSHVQITCLPRVHSRLTLIIGILHRIDMMTSWHGCASISLVFVRGIGQPPMYSPRMWTVLWGFGVFIVVALFNKQLNCCYVMGHDTRECRAGIEIGPGSDAVFVPNIRFCYLVWCQWWDCKLSNTPGAPLQTETC